MIISTVKRGMVLAKRKWTIEEVEEYRRDHNQYFFYYNKEDANFLVPKANGLGKTNNWAHPLSGVIVIVVLALMVYHAFFK
ncbi:hypothetical protein Desaci_1670 [Desulfosporosinus acidiphilus SJ4]|uniref:DUF5808 domain-containing protein n=1 Tax=Desulfosporosinus acidiphilus (strain DSM 22704 / JCM 16185 / SJ4) TaxID=646529 RepID=I4D4E0_DESAJ|nr:hypothetical protein Desaci_1670 [Desulfosporosinus acidiphilus SJ4]